MVIQEVELALTQLIQIYKDQISSDSSIRSVYLYGSYIRGDFISGKSVLNFAVFLDVPAYVSLTNHPDLVFFKFISENILNSLDNSLFRPSSSLSKFICKIFSVNDLRKLTRHEEIEFSESNINLTFLAFDFFKYNRILWGKDVLKDFNTIPDPMKYKNMQFELVKKNYFLKKEKNRNLYQNVNITLGNLISYFAIIEGIRDISKQKLRDWAESYQLFNQTSDIKSVIDQFFIYSLLDNVSHSYVPDDDWVKRAQSTIEALLGENSK